MATKVRIQMLRVTSANRLSLTPLAGEWLYETDTGFVYIGDGTTAGGTLVSSGGGSVVSSVNGETGVVTLESQDIPRLATVEIAATDVEGALIENRGVSDTNTTNIATNTGNIATNAADILALQAAVADPNLRTWIINGGGSNLPANGTEQISWGNNAANDGIVMFRDGEIIGHSLHANPVGTAGSASGTIIINGTNQTGAGEQIVLDGNVGVDGELVSRLTGALDFVTPIQYNAGDIIDYGVITSGWAPTASDVCIAVFMRDR